MALKSAQHRSLDRCGNLLLTLGINDFYFGDREWPYPLGAMQMLGKSDTVLIGFDVPDAPDPADLARHSIDFLLTTEDLPRPETG